MRASGSPRPGDAVIPAPAVAAQVRRRRYGPGDTGVHPPGRPARIGRAGPPVQDVSAGRGARPGRPIERVMSTVIRKLAWSRLANPRSPSPCPGPACCSGCSSGRPRRTPRRCRSGCRCHTSCRRWANIVVAPVMLYTGNVLACLGLAGMLWAHSQGWRPDPRPAADQRGHRRGDGQPHPGWLLRHRELCGIRPDSGAGRQPVQDQPAGMARRPLAVHPRRRPLWKHSRLSTAPSPPWSRGSRLDRRGERQHHHLGPDDPQRHRLHRRGLLLLKTSDDPVRATLFWTANPVLIQQLVSGGHLDTFVAAAAICAIQVARRVSGMWGDVLIGVLIGLACGIKINAVLIGSGSPGRCCGGTSGCAPPGSRGGAGDSRARSTASTGPSR